MPSVAQNAIIKRVNKGKVEFFTITFSVSARQRKTFRANKARFLRKLFEEAGYEVNDFFVSTDFDDRLNSLLDRTPPTQTISAPGDVVHIVQSDNPSRVCRYI